MGSENWYQHSINRKVLYTDGAKYVADDGGAYWLLDEIAILQPHSKDVAAEHFQVCQLTICGDHSATLACDDGNGTILFSKEIEYTNFHDRGNHAVFANNTIYLPCEY